MPRLGEARVGEITHGHRNKVRSRYELPVHGRAARGAEMEDRRAAAISRACERCGVTVDGNIVTRKACLRRENASGALLAGEAMAYGDAHRFARTSQAKLAAGACCFTRRHR